MAQRGRGFKQSRRRAERSRLLIVTEGLKTEIQYFEGLLQLLRASGSAVRGVRSKGIGKDPSRVLAAAHAINDQDTDGYDEIWLVVDVDEHTTLETALEEGARAGIPIVVSNPCFEIWLLWHYEDCGAHQDTRQAIARLAKHGHTDKQIPNSFHYDAYPEAVRRAAERAAPGEIGPNPSTAMPKLLAALQRRP